MSDDTSRRFSVCNTFTAEHAMLDQVDYILQQTQSMRPADEWLDTTRQAISTLVFLPRRFPLAEEDAFRPYEIRRLIHGSHLVLFTIDDEADTVYVIGLRHGSRLPRADGLHETLDDVRRDMARED
jgi:plasmid stabilization system protein ParE